MMKNIAVFVDVQNIYYTTRDAFGRQFNYQALWDQLSHDGNISFANAYAIERNDSKQLGFQKALRHIGFNIKLKPFIQRRDGSAKGDWDVGITIDMLTVAPTVDHIVLLSGDGDFDLLMETVAEQHGATTQVIAVAELTARSLIDACQQFLAIDESLLL